MTLSEMRPNEIGVLLTVPEYLNALRLRAGGHIRLITSRAGLSVVDADGARLAICRELAENDSKSNFRPRFSPGYGDFPLTAQRDIFAILDCPKRIGLSLNQSLLLSPTKSVTAVIGKEQRTK